MAAALVLALAAGVFRLLRRDYAQHGRLTLRGAVLQLALFAVHAALAGLGLMNTSWPGLPDSCVRVLAGLGIGGLGLGILLAVFGVIGSIRRVLGREAGGLKQSGVYRWSRNPQSVGYGLFLLALAVLWPAWQMAVLLLAYAGIVHKMALVEEEHLRRLHGEEFTAYCERTARYAGLPRPG